MSHSARSLMVVPLVLAAALLALPGVASAQMMGDGDGMQPKPADPGSATQPATPKPPKPDGEPGTDMGPFHRPNPGEHNPDAGKMGQNGPAAPAFREIVEVVTAGLGLEGETAESFKRILLGTQTEQEEARAGNQAEQERVASDQRQAVSRLLTPEQTEKVYQVVQGVERYRGQLRNVLAAGNSPAARQARNQLDEAADAYLRNIFGDERGGEFARWFVSAWKGAEIAQGQLVEHMGQALELPPATIIRVQLISTSTRRLQARSNEQLQQRLRAIQDKQTADLQSLLTEAQMQRLGRIHLASEGYKGAMADLQRAARQPGVTRDAIAEQRRKIESAARQQFRELIEPEHYDRFIELWERVIAAEQR